MTCSVAPVVKEVFQHGCYDPSAKRIPWQRNHAVMLVHIAVNGKPKSFVNKTAKTSLAVSSYFMFINKKLTHRPS